MCGSGKEFDAACLRVEIKMIKKRREKKKMTPHLYEYERIAKY